MIIDNDLVAYESLHAMHCRRSSRRGSMAMKLDISKVYDWVEWPFLKGIMTRLGLPEVWIDRVLTCVMTLSLMVELMVISHPIGESGKETLYHLICFYCVQRDKFTVCLYVGELPVYPIYYLLMILCYLPSQSGRGASYF